MSKAIPKGMRVVDLPEVEQDDLNILRPEQFSNGGVAVFHAMRTIGTGDRAFQVYVISSAKSGPDGVKVGVRATRQLDLALAGIVPGEQFFIQYEGRQPNPRNPDMFTHKWTIAREEGKAQQVQESAKATATSQFE